MSSKIALLIIDLQHAYFSSEELAKHRDEVVARTNELIATARTHEVPVVQIRTEHQRDRSTWTPNMLDDDQGFAFPGTEEAQFLPELDTQGTLEVIKTRDDAFHGTELHEILVARGVTHVVICGVSTHSCVVQTAISAFAHNFYAAVACEAVASDKPGFVPDHLEFLREELRQPLLDQAGALAALTALESPVWKGSQ